MNPAYLKLGVNFIIYANVIYVKHNYAILLKCIQALLGILTNVLYVYNYFECLVRPLLVIIQDFNIQSG